MFRSFFYIQISQVFKSALLKIWVLMTQNLYNKEFQRHNFCVIEALVKKCYLTTFQKMCR